MSCAINAVAQKDAEAENASEIEKYVLNKIKPYDIIIKK